MLTVDGEVVDRCHGADRVADPALVGTVIGTVHGLYKHGLVAHGEGGPVIRLEELTALPPFPGDDGARGHAAEAGGAQIFDQGGCGAVDDGSGNRSCRDNSAERRHESKHTEGGKGERGALFLSNPAARVKKGRIF